jgi:hypothetical protein
MDSSVTGGSVYERGRGRRRAGHSRARVSTLWCLDDHSHHCEPRHKLTSRTSEPHRERSEVLSHTHAPEPSMRFAEPTVSASPSLRPSEIIVTQASGCAMRSCNAAHHHMRQNTKPDTSTAQVVRGGGLHSRRRAQSSVAPQPAVLVGHPPQ